MACRSGIMRNGKNNFSLTNYRLYIGGHAYKRLKIVLISGPYLTTLKEQKGIKICKDSLTENDKNLWE